MTARGPRIFRLDIIYPEGSREPGWRPACWSRPDFLARLSKKERRVLANREFAWPRERMFLSSSSAYARAWLLRWYGADVEVEASDPVTWLNRDDEDRQAAGKIISDVQAMFEAAGASMGVILREHAEFYARYFEGSPR